MPDPLVHITNGIPDSGTGNITTLGQLQVALQADNLVIEGKIDAVAAAIVAATLATPVPMSNSVLTNFGHGFYQDVAASTGPTTIQESAGAAGDFLEAVIIIPETNAAGIVSLGDGGGTAVHIFEGGSVTPLPTLAPIRIDFGIFSKAGAWKITTGANVHVRAIGKFS